MLVPLNCIPSILHGEDTLACVNNLSSKSDHIGATGKVVNWCMGHKASGN